MTKDEGKAYDQWLKQGKYISLSDHEAALVHRDKRVAELEAVVAKLPKTKDRVPVVPGDVVYHPNGQHSHVTDARGVRLYMTGEWVGVDTCYSTREAAEAARDAAPQPEAEH